jgi:hypothetical protein
MPIPFQIGLFLTVLVLAGVRFERSLREVARLGRPRRLLARPAIDRESSEAYGWGRWYHLVLLWGIVLFCVPLLLGIAFPGKIIVASKAVDIALTGGLEPTAVEADATTGWDVPPLGAEEIRHLERGLDEQTARAKEDVARESERTGRTVRNALLGFAAALAMTLSLAAAATVARRAHRPDVMTGLAGAALAVSAAGFCLAGPISSRLSAVGRARRAVHAYATARVVRAEDARLFAGPVKLVGRPGAVVGAEPGYLYFKGGGGRDEDAATGSRALDAHGTAAAPYAGFRVGEVAVAPATPEDLRVAFPHVRLGQDGREVFIRDDEDVLVIGYMLSGKVAPRPGYPVIVAPAGAASLGRHGVPRTLGAGLLGAERKRTRYLVMLQLVFGALAAWFLTVVCSACTEYLVARRAARRSETEAAAGRSLV